MNRIPRRVLSRDSESLARACKAILSLDPCIEDSNSTIQGVMEVAEASRAKKDWRALQLILKEHIEWVNGLPAATREKVREMLISEGLQASADIDAERIQKVLKRRKIKSASEFEAVSRSLDNMAAESPPVRAQILSELVSVYLAQKLKES